LKISRKILAVIVIGIMLQASVYIYLDQVLLAPSSSFQVTEADQSQGHITGKAYYSFDRRFMAITKENSVEIYSLPGKMLVRTITLENRRVSYFKWLDDRNLALLGTYPTGSSTTNNQVILAQINPLTEGHELSTKLTNLPKDSKITEVAFSTATNVIYMQVQVSANPDRYRIYRTDANQELARIYFNNNNVGRIGVLYDQDSLIFDNLDDNTVMVRHGNGSWKTISPAKGKYRLVNVDGKNVIHIAKLNANGLADEIVLLNVTGNVLEKRTLPTPMDIAQLRISTLNK